MASALMQDEIGSSRLADNVLESYGPLTLLWASCR